MAEYVNKEMFLSSMGLVGDETKYGNRDSEHQSRSYGTWMGYEIMDSIDDCVEEDAVSVVRCKDCKHRGYEGECPMYWLEEIEWDDDGYTECDYVPHDYTHDDGFCDRGERKGEGDA